MKIFYFTATGNSLAVAKAIGGELVSIPQEMRRDDMVYEDDAIGVVFPVYSATVPIIVEHFLSLATLRTPYLFGIATYGNTAGGALDALQKIARRNALSFHYLNQIRMVDNYLPGYDIDAEIEKLPAKGIDAALATIVQDVRERRQQIPSISFGNRLLTRLLGSTLSQGNSVRKPEFLVNDVCTKCEVCEKVCPMGNIDALPEVSFGDRCISCYACIHACPKTAIHLKNEKSAKRWRHPDVTLQEIVEANQIKE